MRSTKKIRRLNFKRLVLNHLDKVGMTQTQLVEKLNGKVAASTVYRFLDKGQKMPIKSDSLENILDVLRGDVIFKNKDT